ncbi:MAG: hypothetical protein CMO55_12600 [Verrucomicrobiales bacterium]|nr:hypothetical protein [Verrucomicrobiales bacterium]
MTPYQQFVLENERWFRGRFRESDESIAGAESTLGVTFPLDLKWVLMTYGYWHATGVSALEDTIEKTLAARTHVALPHSWIVLYDHDDGGVFLLNTSGEEEVVGLSWGDVPENLFGDVVFRSLLLYSQHLIEVERAALEEEDIEYDPARFNDPPPTE